MYMLQDFGGQQNPGYVQNQGSFDPDEPYIEALSFEVGTIKI